MFLFYLSGRWFTVCTLAPTDLSLREVSVELPDADSEQPEDDVHSVGLDLRLYEHHTPVAERPTHQRWKIERERERNVLFNDALNTFYLRLYGVRHMVKDHSDSEKGNPYTT